MVWSVNNNIIYKINEEPIGNIITKDDILAYARRNGYVQFNVLSEDGRYLSEDDFPFAGNVRVIPVGKLG